MTQESHGSGQVKIDKYPLDVVFFLDSPQSIAFTLDMLTPYFQCTVSHACEAAKGDGTGRELGSAAVLLVVNRAGLSACCRMTNRLSHAWPKRPLMVLTDQVETAGIVRLLGCGAVDFAELRGSPAETLLRVRRAVGTLPSQAEALDIEDEPTPVDAALRSRLIGNAPEFLKLLKRLPAMARSTASVMLLGETGTGKEVCARAIHYCSPRSQGPWVAINCAAIPPELVEDEFYGHVRGAYTHAHATRDGLVHEAEGGTLLLDEVDSLSLAAQAKLLRFLQDGEYRPVGSSSVLHADVRVIAASNCDLRLAVLRGHFRQDLFFRLNVLSLTMPPLRERREDIAALAAHFVDQANREADRHVRGISPDALRRLLSYTWPGNIRELKHVVQRAIVLTENSTLEAADIELDDGATAEHAVMSFREAKARAVENFERCYLEQLLAQSDGNISHAARAAQKDRRAFFELLRRHAIDASRFRLN